MADKSPWKWVREATAPNGDVITMRHGTWGKGRSKIHKWEIFRNGAKENYAVNQADADVNFDRALAGLPPLTGR